MKLYKKSERILRADNTLEALRASGFETRLAGEWCKWKELSGEARVQIKITVYEISGNGKNACVVVDGFGMIAADITSKDEVLAWLKEHGYKGIKQWYLEDCGMDEETWNAWNE